MNRREFFRRTVPAVAVTVAAASSGWSLASFKRVMRRVFAAIEQESREALIVRQLKYQVRMAIEATSRKMGEMFYGADEPQRLNDAWA